jgi:putative nucleotidyltransferase with HDIG domain
MPLRNVRRRWRQIDMGLRTRVFILCFTPFALLLAGSFWMIQGFVLSAVRDNLRTSLRAHQQEIARIEAKNDLENNRFLRVAGENSSLKAGMELLQSNSGSDSARNTVEDQLRELGEHMGFDFLLVSGPDGKPIGGVARHAGVASAGKEELVPMNPAAVGGARNGLLTVGGRTFQVASVPIDQDQENLGSLSVGARFDISQFTTPTILFHNGEVIESNIRGISLVEQSKAIAGCKGESECQVRLAGANWLLLPMQSFGGGYVLSNLEDVDAATAPVQARLRSIFLTMAILCVLAAIVCSFLSARSIVKPIAKVVAKLRNAELTGVLPEFNGQISSATEICELVNVYNRAAASLRMAGERLEAAHVQFVGSLAHALDARDRYTAGHSNRVSHLAVAVARAMELEPRKVEWIRTGALLHDIGKIGIPDHVLQKPGKLTEEEWAMIKEHPVIGRRILEGVSGLAYFLGAVEFHHENWDGSGYPKGQHGEQTPIDARIIHVSDAFDAMTSDRPYRPGMKHERALEILCENAGTQFDPRIVDLFVNLPDEVLHWQPASAKPAASARDIEFAEAV